MTDWGLGELHTEFEYVFAGTMCFVLFITTVAAKQTWEALLCLLKQVAMSKKYTAHQKFF